MRESRSTNITYIGISYRLYMCYRVLLRSHLSGQKCCEKLSPGGSAATASTRFATQPPTHRRRRRRRRVREVARRLALCGQLKLELELQPTIRPLSSNRALTFVRLGGSLHAQSTVRFNGKNEFHFMRSAVFHCVTMANEFP